MEDILIQVAMILFVHYCWVKRGTLIKWLGEKGVIKMKKK